MSLIDLLNKDMKEAMRAKDKETLSVIRLLKASVQNAMIDAKKELNEEEELSILARELKQRKDSFREFQKADRQDLVDKTAFEISVVEKYLPKQLSKEDIQMVIVETVQQVGATSAKDFGKVMGPVMAKLKGQADGNVVNSLVKDVLNSMN